MTNHDNIAELGKAIKLHRKRANLSQAELAKMSDVGKTLIFDIEHGHVSIRLDALCRILSVLNMKLDLSGEFLESSIRLNDATS